jgi:hypothetical protein
MSPGDALKKRRGGVAAFFDVVFWPFVWAAAEVKSLAAYVLGQIARFKA